MKIYLKGYYGYKNFGDELLLFGVIKEIFSRYSVEHLVIDFMIHWLRRLVKVGKPNDIKGYNFEVIGSLDIETQG